MENFIHNLASVPFWAWVVVPVILIAAVTYFITKTLRHTVIVTLLASLAAWLTAGFHFWEMYLNNHFIGSYDSYGLPSNFSRSGWHLLVDAWALWLTPSITILLIAIIGLFYLYNYHFQRRHTAAAKKAMSGVSSESVVSQLEIKKLKRQLTVAKEKLRELKNQEGNGKKSSAAAEEIRQAHADVLAKKKEIQQLGQQIRMLEDELKRAKALIERLLNERSNDTTPHIP